MLFLGGPGDRPRAQEIIDHLRAEFVNVAFQNCCGELTLSQSVAMLVESPEFWGIDSSLLHMARIVGLRCVSYWGPTDPATRLRETWDLDETTHYRKIACSPCVHTSEEPPCHGDNRCIQGLFGESVRDKRRLDADRISRASPQPRTIVKKILSWGWDNIGSVCVALVLIYCVIHAFDPPRLNWGDSGSDYNVLMSGQNFQRYGFLKLRLTPFLLDPAFMTRGRPRLRLHALPAASRSDERDAPRGVPALEPRAVSVRRARVLLRRARLHLLAHLVVLVARRPRRSRSRSGS